MCALGDSHTNGGRYLDEVHAQLGSDGTALGYIGHGAKVIAGHMPEVLAMRPAIVIVQAGVNDLASGRSLGHTQRWLSAMYRDVRAAGATVVAIPILPWARYLDQPRLKAHKGTFLRRTRALNAWIAGELAAGRIDAVVDVRGMRDSTGALNRRYALKDGLHLNGAGQRFLGGRVVEAIRRAKKLKRNVPESVVGGSVVLRRFGELHAPQLFSAQ